MAVFTHVIAGHHRKRFQPFFTTQPQGFDDVTNRGLRRSRVFQIVLDQWVIEIQLTACRISAVAFFRDCQRDNRRLRTRHRIENTFAAVDFRMQRFFHRTDNFQLGAFRAFFRHGVQQLLFFQVFDQHAVVAWHQVNFADTPVAVGAFQQVMGIQRLVRAVKRPATEMHNA